MKIIVKAIDVKATGKNIEFGPVLVTPFKGKSVIAPVGTFSIPVGEHRGAMNMEVFSSPQVRRVKPSLYLTHNGQWVMDEHDPEVMFGTFDQLFSVIVDKYPEYEVIVYDPLNPNGSVKSGHLGRLSPLFEVEERLILTVNFTEKKDQMVKFGVFGPDRDWLVYNPSTRGYHSFHLTKGNPGVMTVDEGTPRSITLHFDDGDLIMNFNKNGEVLDIVRVASKNSVQVTLHLPVTHPLFDLIDLSEKPYVEVAN